MSRINTASRALAQRVKYVFPPTISSKSLCNLNGNNVGYKKSKPNKKDENCFGIGVGKNSKKTIDRQAEFRGGIILVCAIPAAFLFVFLFIGLILAWGKIVSNVADWWYDVLNGRRK
jgi:hypothetical protein